MFEGKLLHSQDYRKPEDLTEKSLLPVKIVTLGGKNSSVDIAMQLASSSACEVTISHRNRERMTLPTGVTQCEAIVECLGPKSFKLSDGSELDDVDVLMFCTGYVRKFPFLSEESEVNIVENGAVVDDLYRSGRTGYSRKEHFLFRHCVHGIHPSLLFLGLTYSTSPAVTSHYSAKWLVDEVIWRRNVPSLETIRNEIILRKTRMKDSKMKPHEFHNVKFPVDGDLWDALADECGVERAPEWLKRLFVETQSIRAKLPHRYKSTKMRKLAENGGYAWLDS